MLSPGEVICLMKTSLHKQLCLVVEPLDRRVSSPYQTPNLPVGIEGFAPSILRFRETERDTLSLTPQTAR